MSIHIKTNNPDKLLEDIRHKAMCQELDTWSIDEDGDFTHTPNQWQNEAWFRSVVRPDELVFGLVKRRDKEILTVVYGVYHGRFAEMLLTHFDYQISSILLTSFPDEFDSLG
jgi:hypothetical protein